MGSKNDAHCTVKSAAHFLARLHLGYEGVAMSPARAEKRRFDVKDDRTTLRYNDKITVTDIPRAAYEYVVNGKPALEWMVERQRISEHTAWRVITVSLETLKIVRSLPSLVLFEEQTKPEVEVEPA